MDIIQTPIPSSFPPPGGYVVLASPQYGPAWVADCYGTTHQERLAVILHAEMGDGVARITGDDPDQVAVAWARLVTNDGEDAVIGVTDWMPEPEGPADRPVRRIVNDEDYGCWS
jgi:hypothetical protein